MFYVIYIQNVDSTEDSIPPLPTPFPLLSPAGLQVNSPTPIQNHEVSALSSSWENTEESVGAILKSKGLCST